MRVTCRKPAARPRTSRLLAALAALAGSAALSGCVTVDPSRSVAEASPPALPTVLGAGTYVAGTPPAPQWTDVLARHNRARAVPAAVPAEWRRMVDSLRGLDPRARVERANSEINRVRYARSELNWGRRDYWETPFELIAGSGQCQDFAVAKYLLLREAGVPAEQLRVVVVQDSRAGLAHAVLVADVGGAAVILDNQIEHVVPASSVGHYEPLYALGEDGWWLYDRAARPARGATTAFSRSPAAADS